MRRQAPLRSSARGPQGATVRKRSTPIVSSTARYQVPPQPKGKVAARGWKWRVSPEGAGHRAEELGAGRCGPGPPQFWAPQHPTVSRVVRATLSVVGARIFCQVVNSADSQAGEETPEDIVGDILDIT